MREYPASDAVCPKDGSPLLEPVSRALSRGPLPLMQAVKIVDRVCQHLAPLHAAGKVHGQLSAETVFFRHIGIELTVAVSPIGEQRPQRAHFTPPERIRREPEDRRSDIYALGVLLHSMIAGKPPFDGATDREIFEQHTAGRRPSLTKNSLQDVPEELDKLIGMMLAKPLDGRPRSVEELRARIENLDLDSTIMGVRLTEVRDQVKEEMRSDPTAQPIETDGLDEPTIRGMEPIRNIVDPYVDPYGDTFVRRREELDIEGTISDDPDAVADTHLSISNRVLVDARGTSKAELILPASASAQTIVPSASPAMVARRKLAPEAITEASPPPAPVQAGLPMALMIAALVILAAALGTLLAILILR